MVHIVTGDKNSGKTTKIKNLYAAHGGDGFISNKIIQNGIFYGYQLTRLSSGESIDFIYENKYAPVHWEDTLKNIRFTFYRPAFDTAYHWMHAIIRNEDSPIYIDEVGKLELNKQGFYEMIKDVVNSNKEIYIALRELYLVQFLEAFTITEYAIIKVS
ncbi:nucleoside-triphosphatase [Cellulosilyticum sp. I15G10I2]|uniref:nucleoside-triphosphatase n=1 Tax=Cellulosilyticum sp. I15G10I2 TaxID=1892843 RepID=UPI00085CC9FB|nr:nucleoside-triphosphatase [Cellulosilyticum sp. I15G10I2]